MCSCSTPSIPALRQYTSTPISFLPSACDTLLSCPYPEAPPRSIDVLSLGRRMPELHTKLSALAAHDGNFFYVHDVLKAGAVTDWAEHRAQSAAMIKRAKYFIAYDFTVDTTGVFKGVRKNALATRYFEGTAGGAIVLGSRQHCPEFDDHFDWPDAVIELPPARRTWARSWPTWAARARAWSRRARPMSARPCAAMTGPIAGASCWTWPAFPAVRVFNNGSSDWPAWPAWSMSRMARRWCVAATSPSDRAVPLARCGQGRPSRRAFAGAARTREP